MFKSIIFTFISVLALSSVAQDWKSLAEEVKPESEIQKKIDALVIEVFKSPIRQRLCQVLGSSLAIKNSFGVSDSAAVDANHLCQRKERLELGLGRTMPKKYFVVPYARPDVESWTDLGNRTYFFLSENTSDFEFRNMLLHELAISLDSKFGQFFISYVRNQNNFKKLSSPRAALEEAFRIAVWLPVANTFASMRAFAFEQSVLGKSSNLTHLQCAEKFHYIFNHVSQIPDLEALNKSNEIDHILTDLVDSFSSYLAPRSDSDREQKLKFILNKDLLIYDEGQNITFCQYMAKYSLTNTTRQNVTANGPRPRLTGGSGL